MTDEKPVVPPPPWTVEALGEETYIRLAVAYGCFDPRCEPHSYRPSLDLTAWFPPLSASSPVTFDALAQTKQAADTAKKLDR